MSVAWPKRNFPCCCPSCCCCWVSAGYGIRDEGSVRGNEEYEREYQVDGKNETEECPELTAAQGTLMWWWPSRFESAARVGMYERSRFDGELETPE
eukprot:gene1901-55622_t